MTTFAMYLAVTFACGVVVVLLRLPPLLGFLAAGFVLHAMHTPNLPGLHTIADLGVTLLLFGIGLKLDLRTLVRKEVWLAGGLHIVGCVLVYGGFLGLLGFLGVDRLAAQDWQTLAMLGLAFAFSSTVFIVKVLEERGDTQALYGRVAIGILVLQDLVAVVFLTATSGRLPSPWALALVLLWPASYGFRWIWSRIGHGEMQALFGILMALVPGYWLFELVGLKGDLGALIMGVLLASHPAAEELSRSLFHLKELLLIGFFLTIGTGGLPDLTSLLIALAIVALLPLKQAGFALLMWLVRLRYRTSVLVGLSLGNYSEFGLIVVAVLAGSGRLDDSWLALVSVAVAGSFLLSALSDNKSHEFVEKVSRRLPPQDPAKLNPEDRPRDAGGAQALVVGMGRVGYAAYQRLSTDYGLTVVGVESDGHAVNALTSAGLNVVEGDATDSDFWRRMTGDENLRIAVLAMPRHGTNVLAADVLRENGFEGRIAAAIRFPDETSEATGHGINIVLEVYPGAGLELADQLADAAGVRRPKRPEQGWVTPRAGARPSRVRRRRGR